MKKIFFTLIVLGTTSAFAIASETPAELRSAENLKKTGYSDSMVEIVQKESGEFTTTPLNKWQRYGFKIWNYIDPVSPEPRDRERHNIKPYSHYEDL